MRAQFKDAANEHRAGGELRTVSPNLHLNCLFKHVIDGVELSVMAEVQIYSTAILEIKKEGHKAGARGRCVLPSCRC